MKRILLCCMSLIMTITMLVGCGDKENTLNEGKEDKQ